jgi:hypothetical protein
VRASSQCRARREDVVDTGAGALLPAVALWSSRGGRGHTGVWRIVLFRYISHYVTIRSILMIHILIAGTFVFCGALLPAFEKNSRILMSYVFCLSLKAEVRQSEDSLVGDNPSHTLIGRKLRSNLILSKLLNYSPRRQNTKSPSKRRDKEAHKRDLYKLLH